MFVHYYYYYYCLASCNNEYRALEERKLTDIMKQNGCMTVRIPRYSALSVSIATALSRLVCHQEPNHWPMTLWAPCLALVTHGRCCISKICHDSERHYLPL